MKVLNLVFVLSLLLSATSWADSQALPLPIYVECKGDSGSVVAAIDTAKTLSFKITKGGKAISGQIAVEAGPEYTGDGASAWSDEFQDRVGSTIQTLDVSASINHKVWEPAHTGCQASRLPTCTPITIPGAYDNPLFIDFELNLSVGANGTYVFETASYWSPEGTQDFNDLGANTTCKVSHK